MITVQPLPLSVAPGDRAGFVVSATGAAPLTYQWFHEGAVVAGGNTDLILLPAAQLSDAGKYTVKVTNASGSVTSSAAELMVATYTTQLVERTYSRPEGLSGLVRAVPLPDGRVLIAWRGNPGATNTAALLAMYRADGSTDSSFKASLPALSAVQISDVILLDGNQVLVCGTAGATDFTSTPFLRRLNADGTEDLTFQPSSLSRAPSALCVLGDGYVLLQETKLVRLSRSGAVDTSFAYDPGIVVRLVRPDGQGRLLVGIGARLLRLNADGREDLSFTPVVFDGNIADVQSRPDGAMMLAYRTTKTFPFGSIVAGTYHLARYTSQGQLDPKFQEFTFSQSGPAGGGGVGAFVLVGDGTVIVSGDFNSIRADANRSYARTAGMLRLFPDGTLDPDYSVLDKGISNLVGASRALALTVDAKHVLASDGLSNVVRRISLETVGAPQPPRILRCVPRSTAWNAGDDVIVDLVAVGSGPLSPSPAGTDNGIVAVPNVQQSTGDRFVVVAGPGGSAVSEPYRLTIIPTKPRMISEPQSITTGLGYQVKLAVTVRGSEPLRYLWTKDGVPISQSSSEVTFLSLAASDAGVYRVQITNSEGMAESAATIQIGPHAELRNLSARAMVGSGERALIIGYVVGGDGYNSALLRGVGPELEKYGVQRVLADPTITLHYPNGEVEVNDDDPERMPYLGNAIENQVGATPLPIGSKSSLLSVGMTSGVYLLDVTGVSGTTGIALGEIYQAQNSSCHLVNLSARAYVGTGDATAISGFVIKGDKPKRILVRAVGPTLTKYGIAEVLANPVLKLVSSATGKEIAANDDWSASANAEELRTAMGTAGAFPLESGSRDAAMIVTLPEGAYSALVTGADGGSGIALMEVYDLD